MEKQTGRKKNQLPHCYYEGFLEKKLFKDKTSKKWWTCLCGDTLFFFNNKRDNDYTEKVDLRGFISVTDDSSLDCNLEAAKFTLQMKDGDIKFSAPSSESRELWKGFIQSVAELSVPSSLNLLPGQIHMMNEAVKKEEDRIRNVPSTTNTDPNPYASLHPEMPTCYYAVSRLEAQFLLEREARRGNMLLRPGSNRTSFAISTRQELDKAIYRHYRVTRNEEGGFVIAVNNPVHCATLHDVVTYLVDTTDGVLIPLVVEGHYEKTIIIVSSDNESGEKMEQTLPSSIPPRLPAKQEPATEPDAVEKLEKKEKTVDSPAVPPRKPGKKLLKKVVVPPAIVPRKGKAATSPPPFTSPTNRDARIPATTDVRGQIPLAAISELKLRLEQKGKCQE